ncbi:unnamed protein product [Ectocarpus sp. CCAP 1310/34]|nr:unnamed protein product [Ectocarpus sp. CCAP 1310/34]
MALAAASARQAKAKDGEQQQQLCASCLACPACLQLLAEPVSLPCGHTFCRVCLVKELRRKPKECPSCHATCHTRQVAEDQPQNVMLAQIAKSLFPELLERRLRETEAEKAKFELCLPAFFYSVPVFPGQTLCVHFFEPRYKLMMQRIINTSRRFAYVLPAPVPSTNDDDRNTDQQGRIALEAHVCEAEFLSDDRVMVKIKLAGRHTVVEDFVEAGTGNLHYCQLEPFDDDPLQEGGAGELTDLHTRAKTICNGFLGPFKGQLVEAHGRMPEDAVGLSMWMASLLPFYPPDKHSLVRSRCTRRRMRACLDCAASMEEMAQAAARREEKSSTGDMSAGEGQQQQPPPRPSQPAAEAAAEAAAVAVAQAGVSGGSASAWEDEGERSSRSARQRQRR